MCLQGVRQREQRVGYGFHISSVLPLSPRLFDSKTSVRSITLAHYDRGAAAKGEADDAIWVHIGTGHRTDSRLKIYMYSSIYVSGRALASM